MEASVLSTSDRDSSTNAAESCVSSARGHSSEKSPHSPSILSALLSRILDKVAFIAPGGGSLRPWLHKLRGVKIGRHVWIAQMVYIDELHPGDVEIGDYCTIGHRSSIFTHFYWGRRRASSSGKVVIEKDVFVGPHCVILPNVRIGEGAVIRAGTVVSRNVPPHGIWGLPPAELVGIATVPLTPEHTYEEFTRGMRPAPHTRTRTNADAQHS